MVTRRTSSIQFYADFGPVEHALAAAEALYEIDREPGYLDNLLEVAWASSNKDFNEQAAAAAASGANIRHMFEWGTVGINRRRTNFRPGPLTERARLWKPNMVGKGLPRILDYDFKPSMAFVPKPTKGETGMSTDAIEQLKNHIFTNKAMVMESGMTVTIARKPGTKFLLLPMYKGNIPPNARKNDIARGYTLIPGPLSLRPGARSVGRFNAFWVNYWNTTGEVLINQSAKAQIELDFDPEFNRLKSSTPRRPTPGAVDAGVARAKKAIKAKTKAKSRSRRKAVKTDVE